MNLPVAPDFEFHTTNRNTVIKVIESLKIKNSCGFDMMSTKLLQNVKIEICDIIIVMINQSFVSRIFPDKLNSAKVVPLYKKIKRIKLKTVDLCLCFPVYQRSLSALFMINLMSTLVL